MFLIPPRNHNMRSFGHKVAASLAASIWTAVLGIVFVPVYVTYLGIEAYGLVGLFAMVQSFASLLDLGLSTTMNRELARYSAGASAVGRVEDFICTLERVYWTIGGCLGCLLAALVPLLATRWVTTVSLSADVVQDALLLSAAMIAFQWPFGLYVGGLMGLNRQVLLGGMNALIAAVRGGGAVFVLVWVSPTVHAFFLWQALVSLASTLAVRHLLMRAVGSGRRGRFDGEHLRRTWRFAGGMTLVSVLGLVLLQTDKVILSRMLTLEEFGYYTLAGTVAISVYRLVAPVFSVVFPSLTSAAVAADPELLRRLYHKSAGTLSVALLPACVALALFSPEIMFVWTGNPQTAEKTHLLVTTLVIGYGIQGLMHVPWALQLAFGWTGLSVRLNGAAILLIVPFTVLLTRRYGAIGGATTWAAANLLYLVIGVEAVHHRLLKGASLRWYLVDTGIPLMAVLAVAIPARYMIPVALSRLQLGLLLAGLFSLWQLAAAASSGSVRRWLLGQASHYRLAVRSAVQR